MSHKAGHIIIQSLKAVPTLTTDQVAHLNEIEARDQYTMADRMYLCVLTYQVADDLVEDH